MADFVRVSLGLYESDSAGESPVQASQEIPKKKINKINARGL